MRRTGEVADAGGLGVHDHLCWSYDDPEDFHHQVLEFLADGLRQGLRVRYVASGETGELVGHLAGLPDLERHLRRGAVEVASLGDTYSSDRVVVPAEQVRAYATATRDARAAGFTGLRVAAEATGMVRTSAQAEAFAAYEHLIDRYMVTHPFSALCAYRRPELPAGTVAELASLHPAARQGSALFRLHATGADDPADYALAGEVDVTNRQLLDVALDRADPEPAGAERSGGPLTIDGCHLRFIDHRGLLVLSDHARRRGTTVALRTSNPMTAWLAERLDLDGVRVETA